LMEDSVSQGKIGSFGVGSGGEKISELLAERPSYARTLQYEWSVLDAAIPAGGPFRIHHRALTDNFRALHSALIAKPEICSRWSQETGLDLANSEALARLMLKTSLVMNPESVILFSSKRSAHIVTNVRVAEDVAIEAPARRLHALVQAERGELLGHEVAR
jgi:D-threo-aldose 1-dehydrogenase